MTTRSHTLSLFVTRCTTRCHSLSLVVIRSHSLYHSLSLDVPLVCLFINDRCFDLTSGLIADGNIRKLAKFPSFLVFFYFNVFRKWFVCIMWFIHCHVCKRKQMIINKLEQNWPDRYWKEVVTRSWPVKNCVLKNFAKFTGKHLW